MRSSVKTNLFTANFVRKPRHSSTMPVFSFAFDEKIFCFAEKRIAAAPPV